MDQKVAPIEQQFPAFAPSNHALLKKYLTRDVWVQLKDRETSNGVSLHDCIRSGIANTDSEVGLYAGDAHSYSAFAPLFAPVIADCHPGFRVGDVQHSSLEATDFQPANPDIGGRYVLSTRIRVARNLSGHGLRPTATYETNLEVERQAKGAFAAFSGDLAGEYS